MPWIKVVEPDAHTATEPDNLHSEILNAPDTLAKLYAIHSLFPEALRAHIQLRQVLLHGNLEISRTDVELIAAVVSIENGCDYSAAHHRNALNELLQSDDRNSTLSHEPAEWAFDARQRAMLQLASKLAHTPHAVSEHDIAMLKSHGFTDRAILQIVLIASYLCFVNRITLGLGVALGPDRNEEAR